MTQVNYHRPKLTDYQLEAFFGATRYAWIVASTKSGKAQNLDAMVYTPTGPIRMGDVSVGQVVLTPAGSATVKAIYPQGLQQTYRITFSDGSSTLSTADHLWEIHSQCWEPTTGSYISTRILTTSQLMKLSNLNRRWVDVGFSDYSFQEVPIDPYILGVLLGDGCLGGTCVALSSADTELLDKVSALLPSYHKLKYRSGYDYSITLAPGNYSKSIHYLLKTLNLRCGTLHKFIPDCYKYNTKEVRLAIIQGLMDTDGWVEGSYGSPYFCSSSKQLALDVQELIESLGGYCSIRQKQTTCHDTYIVRITYGDATELFSLSRKKNKCRQKIKRLKRTIKSIEPASIELCQCIELDSTGLYFTDRHIITHNTHAAICWIIEQAILKGGRNHHFRWAAPSIRQSIIAFARIKNALPSNTFTGNDTKLTITLFNGSVISFMSGDDPDSFYGEDCYACVIDEASRCRAEIFPAIRSTLTSTGGMLRMIGNVTTRSNWFWLGAQEAKCGKANHSYFEFSANDAVKAGLYDADELLDAKHSLSDIEYKRLYFNIPPADGGNPFNLAAIAKCVKRLSKNPPVVFGLDLAKSVDWTVLIGLDSDNHVCHFSRWQSSWEHTMTRVRREVGTIPCLVDSTGVGDPIFEQLHSTGPNYMDFKFSSTSKQQLMEGLAVSIQKEELGFPDNEIRIELDAYEYVYFQNGVRYQSSIHDDCVVALALANRLATKPTKKGLWFLFEDQVSPIKETEQYASLNPWMTEEK